MTRQKHQIVNQFSRRAVWRVACRSVALIALTSSIAAQRFVEFDRQQVAHVGYATYTIAAIDLTMNGHTDLLIGKLSGTDRPALSVFENQGGGRFVDRSGGMPGIPEGYIRFSSRALLLHDFTGDGRRDIFVGNDSLLHPTIGPVASRLYVSDGQGGFRDETSRAFAPNLGPLGMSAADGWATSAVAIDVDRDGDLDLVVASNHPLAAVPPYSMSGLRVLLNDGSGAFTLDQSGRVPYFPPGFGGSCDEMCVLDVDRDGHLDLVLAMPSGVTILRNRGDGYFDDQTATRIVQGTQAWPTQWIAIHDMDDDGLPDIVAAEGSAVGYGDLRMLINDGAGRFVEAPNAIPHRRELFKRVRVADFDEDGRPDIVAVTNGGPSYPAGMRIYRGVGNHTFEDVSFSWLPIGENSQSVALVTADLDGDGDIDIAVNDTGDGVPGSGNHARTRIYYNMTRQMTSHQEPASHHVYDVHLRAEPGQLAIVMMSMSQGRIPLPTWGTFLLDPTSTLIFPQPAQLDAYGNGRFWTPRLPDLRPFIGTPIHLQSLFLDPTNPGRTRFSNLVRDYIR